MKPGAHLTSSESLDHFRAALAEFITDASRALDSYTDDVRRTKLWLENDRLPHWERELRRRLRHRERAEQELFQARLSSAKRDLSLQQMQLRHAAEAVRQAEEKIRAIKRWQRDFDPKIAPLLRPIERLRDFVGRNLPQGLLSLRQAADSLEAYHAGQGPRLITNEDGPSPAPSKPADAPAAATLPG